MNSNKHKKQVCIVGAGVAGASLAAYLSQFGIQVSIIEKHLAEQDRIVGELLQPGGVQKLNEMGLGDLLEGYDSQLVYGYALFLKDKHFRLPYPQNSEGKGLRNGKFVQKIRDYISKQPTIEVIEGNVKELLNEYGRISGVKYQPKGSDEMKVVHASLTVICEGAFSPLRDAISNIKGKVSGYFLGLELKNAQLPYPHHGHVMIGEQSPVLLYPIDSTTTRVLIDFPAEQMAPRKSPELIKKLNEETIKQIPASAHTSYHQAVEEAKFKVMPNHYLPAKPINVPGVVLLGDSLNMRHPLTGGGMTVALTDVKNLGDRLSELLDFDHEDSINKAVNEFYVSRHKLNSSINILADALYAVMSNEDLKQAAYDYLRKGGKNAEDSIAILSAISRDRDLLMRHFIGVAIIGAGEILLPMPAPGKIGKSVNMIRSAVDVIAPLVLNEKPGFFTKTGMQIIDKINKIVPKI